MNDQLSAPRDSPPAGKIILGLVAGAVSGVLLRDWLAPWSCARSEWRIAFPFLVVLIVPGGVWTIVQGVSDARRRKKN